MTTRLPCTHYHIGSPRLACGKSYDEVDKFTSSPETVTCRSCLRHLDKIKREKVRQGAKEKLALWNS